MAPNILRSCTLTLKHSVGTAVEVSTYLLLVLLQILQILVFSDSPDINNKLLKKQYTSMQYFKDTMLCVQMEAVKHARSKLVNMSICSDVWKHHIVVITTATQKVEEHVVQRQIESVVRMDL